MKKNIIIISLIATLLIVISVGFVTYGFVMTNTVGNESGKKETFLSRVVSVKYSDGTDTLSTLNQGAFNPGSSIVKSFTVENTGDKEAMYSIYLTNVINTFSRTNDITFELYRNGTLLNKGTFPTEEVVIKENEVVNVNEKLSYTLKIDYLNSSENQIEDSGKNISASIKLSE